MSTRRPARLPPADDCAWTAAPEQLLTSLGSDACDGLTDDSAGQRLLQGRNLPG